MCYGPVVPDGYGVCYNPHPHNIVVCISAFKSNAETQSDHFGCTLEGSLLQMHELCKKTKENVDIQSEKIRNNAVLNGPTGIVGSEVRKNGKQLVRQQQTSSILQTNGNVKEPVK